MMSSQLQKRFSRRVINHFIRTILKSLRSDIVNVFFAREIMLTNIKIVFSGNILSSCLVRAELAQSSQVQAIAGLTRIENNTKNIRTGPNNITNIPLSWNSKRLVGNELFDISWAKELKHSMFLNNISVAKSPIKRGISPAKPKTITMATDAKIKTNKARPYKV